MEAIVACVYGTDDRYLVPMVSSLLHAIIRGKCNVEKIKPSISVYSLVPEITKNTMIERTKYILEEWTYGASYESFGFTKKDNFRALICDSLEREQWTLAAFLQKEIIPDLVVICDDFQIQLFAQDWESRILERVHPLFEDSSEVSKVIESHSMTEKIGYIDAIVKELKRIVWSIFSTIWEKWKNAERDKVVKLHEEPKKEGMLEIIEELDLNYNPDFEVFEDVVRTASRELFAGKPINDWYAWLLGCLVTGIQARIPEASTVWEDRKYFESKYSRDHDLNKS